jgi:hypothetical protein
MTRNFLQIEPDSDVFQVDEGVSAVGCLAARGGFVRSYLADWAIDCLVPVLASY